MGRQIGKGNNINVVDDDDSDSVGSAIFPPMITRTKSGRELFNAINTTGSSSRRRRSQSVHIRSNNGEVAMSRRDRVSAQFRNFLNRFKTSSDGNDDSRVSNAGDPERGTRYTEDKRQYHLIPPKRNQSFCFCVRRGVGFGALSDIKPNEHLASFLHWTFRSSFVVLIFFMCLCFFGLIVGFAFLITAAGRMNEDCVRAGGDPASNFADAFALSWTTFSTVGYGSTYPALSHENTSEDNKYCIFITFICSMESFFGVLYSGLCGAILFGKVLRIQSHAQVTFSDPIVIRYGSGLLEASSGDNDDYDDEGKDDKIPCPVLEFRIVNQLFDQPGGEIMDASLNVVASVNARDADPILVDALNSSRRSKHLRTYSYRPEDWYGNNRPPLNTSDSLLSDNLSDAASLDSRRSKRKFFQFLMSKNHNAIDEDPSSMLIEKLIFSKMYFEQCEHPFFKRVWVGRHILNAESPLVRPKVKREIQKNKGYWPKDRNNYTAVRKSVLFNQILVSLNGVSNLSANEVYAQKIYDYVDVNVGYKFVPILYKHGDGTLRVDTDFINDVREQNGGGGEPLIGDQ